jgi:hypothetical protein
MDAALLYNAFKSDFWSIRSSYNGALCDICGEPCEFENADPHHAVIRQGQSMGMPDDVRTEVRCKVVNCNLVHHAPCHEEAHANPELCVAILIAIWGYEDIDRWVGSLGFKVPFHWNRGLTQSEAADMVKKEAPWVLA